MRPARILLAAALIPAGCAVNDARIAHDAQSRLIGMPEGDLESCLGVPDQHASFGPTDVLTYYATSSSSTSFAIPLVGGIGLSNGGYCHATFQARNGLVTRLLYSGEKNATFAPDAYCAPIVRTCLATLPEKPGPEKPGPEKPGPEKPGETAAPEAPRAAP